MRDELIDKSHNAYQIKLLLSHLRTARQLYEQEQEQDERFGLIIHFVIDCVKTFIKEPISLHYLTLVQYENMMVGVLIGKGEKLSAVGIGRLWEYRNHLPSLRDDLEVAVAENACLFDFEFDLGDFDYDYV